MIHDNRDTGTEVHDRTDAEEKCWTGGYRTGGMQAGEMRTDGIIEEKEGCMKGERQESRDAGHGGCRTEGCNTRRIQDRRDARK